MIRLSCSNVHLRLVKKLPGQPPSGAMVPWAAPAVSPSVMKQPPPAAAVSRHRPARSVGGGEGGATVGAGSGAGVVAQAPRMASMRMAPASFAPCRIKRKGRDRDAHD